MLALDGSGEDGYSAVEAVRVENATMRWCLAYCMLAELCGIDVCIALPMFSTFWSHPMAAAAIQFINNRRVPGIGMKPALIRRP